MHTLTSFGKLRPTSTYEEITPTGSTIFNIEVFTSSLADFMTTKISTGKVLVLSRRIASTGASAKADITSGDVTITSQATNVPESGMKLRIGY